MPMPASGPLALSALAPTTPNPRAAARINPVRTRVVDVRMMTFPLFLEYVLEVFSTVEDLYVTRANRVRSHLSQESCRGCVDASPDYFRRIFIHSAPTRVG